MTDPIEVAAWARFDQDVAEGYAAFSSLAEHLADGLDTFPPEHLLTGLLTHLEHSGRATVIALAALGLMTRAKQLHAQRAGGGRG